MLKDIPSLTVEASTQLLRHLQNSLRIAVYLNLIPGPRQIGLIVYSKEPRTIV